MCNEIWLFYYNYYLCFYYMTYSSEGKYSVNSFMISSWLLWMAISSGVELGFEPPASLLLLIVRSPPKSMRSFVAAMLFERTAIDIDVWPALSLAFTSADGSQVRTYERSTPVLTSLFSAPICGIRCRTVWPAPLRTAALETIPFESSWSYKAGSRAIVNISRLSSESRAACLAASLLASIADLHN